MTPQVSTGGINEVHWSWPANWSSQTPEGGVKQSPRANGKITFKVILAVRNVAAGAEARHSIKQSTGRKDIWEVWELDLVSLSSVQAFWTTGVSASATGRGSRECCVGADSVHMG